MDCFMNKLLVRWIMTIFVLLLTNYAYAFGSHKPLQPHSYQTPHYETPGYAPSFYFSHAKTVFPPYHYDYDDYYHDGYSGYEYTGKYSRWQLEKPHSDKFKSKFSQH